MSLPPGWSITRVDRVATVKARIGWKALTASEYQDEGYAFLSTPNIKTAAIDFGDVNYISQFRYDESPELQLRVGDVLLAKDGSTLGIANIVKDLPRPATVNGSIAVLRPFTIEPRFLMYALQGAAIQEQIQLLRAGMGVPHLFQWDINRLPLTLPSLDVQRRIADFLDDQATRIDNIIAARQQQLNEMTALALSSAAAMTTTGGLRRENVALTGIPWMPERNSDWPLVKIGYLCATGSGTTPPSDRPEYFNGDMPWVNSGDITDDGIPTIARTVTSQALDELSALKVFAPGSLVVAMYGQGDTKGRVGLLPERACVNQACCVLHPDSALSPGWLLHWLRSHKEGIVQLAQGSGQPNLNQELIRNLRIPLPARAEQDRLLPLLETEVSNINAASVAMDESIAYLTEMKRSLITAAVSGEFDVSSADGSGVAV